MWSPGLTLADIEKQAIYDALRFFSGNKTGTAAALGICVRTLANKLDEYEGRKVQEDVESPKSGLHIQPSSKVPEKQPVSMRKR